MKKTSTKMKMTSPKKEDNFFKNEDDLSSLSSLITVVTLGVAVRAVRTWWGHYCQIQLHYTGQTGQAGHQHQYALFVASSWQNFSLVSDKSAITNSTSVKSEA